MLKKNNKSHTIHSQHCDFSHLNRLLLGQLIKGEFSVTDNRSRLRSWHKDNGLSRLLFEYAQAIEEMNSYSTGTLKRGQIGLLTGTPRVKWSRIVGKMQSIEFLENLK